MYENEKSLMHGGREDQIPKMEETRQLAIDMAEYQPVLAEIKIKGKAKMLQQNEEIIQEGNQIGDACLLGFRFILTAQLARGYA